jgi:hypothetical protein
MKVYQVLFFLIAAVSINAHTKGDFGVCGSAADPAVYRPSNATLYYLSTCSGTWSGLTNIGQNSGDQWLSFNDGGSSDVFADFSGFNNRWNVYDRFGGLIEMSYGYYPSGGIAFAGDVNGDGHDDFITYYQGEWTVYINRNHFGTSATYYWGDPSKFDKPLVGDFNNDGRADLGIYRPGESRYYIYYISSNTSQSFQDETYGTMFTSVKVFSANARGNGDEMCRYFPVPKPGLGTWYCIDRTGYGARVFNWGQDDDIPVVGDFRDLGREQLTVFTPSTGEWKAGDLLLGDFTTTVFGGAGDIPIQSGRIH